MKCQKCGRNEVNFHYTTNVNGHVTQTHMCSECANESGYNIEQMFGDMFTGMFPMQKRMASLMPMAIPVLQIDAGFPFTAQPRIKTQNPGSEAKQCTCGCGTVAQNIEVDEKLKQRRELNAQMRIAAENEDFEKAAELRDKIKELDN